MGETYQFLYIEIKQQSSLQNSAMSYSKYLIGGVFLEIPNSMIALNSILGLIFGILGNNLAKTVVNRVNKDSGY